MRRARIALAAAVVAGVGEIAACTDDKLMTSPRSPRASSSSSGHEGSNDPLSNAGKVTLCVDPTSPVGDYTFVYSDLNNQAGLQGNATQDAGFWTDLGGDWQSPTPPAPSQLNDGSTTVFASQTVIHNDGDAIPDCLIALERTQGSQAFRDNLAAGKTAIDTWSGMTITYVSNNAVGGASYKQTNCINDIGVVVPNKNITPLPALWNAATNYAANELVTTDNNPGDPTSGIRVWRALQPNTNKDPPANGTDWTTSNLSDCGPGFNPTRAFANFEHGTVVSFQFEPPTTLPCPAGSFNFSLDGSGNLNIVYDQFPAPNDNSYGVNAVGWPNGHTFGNLTGSDKAGIQLRDQNGVVRLSFNMDYLSADASKPSGYGSLGVTGGDGGMVVGTSSGITVTTSLAKNLNNVNIPGLFNASHVQQFGSVNVLVNSPPTDAAHQTYNISDPTLAGWDFHDTYFATISAAKLASIGFNPATWTVEPNLTVLHNSPAKPCPAGPFDCDLITVGEKTTKNKDVKVDVNNTSAQDAFVTGVNITWPQGTNGNLKEIKIGGDVIWTGNIGGGTASLTLANLVADANKRKIGKNSDEDVKLTFANNVSATLSSYAGTLSFGDDCTKTILP
jgi:hypothetical protein